MPALVYSSSGFPFTAYTKILSADVNSCFTDIRTLLNTTGLDDTNLQNAGITRSTKLKTGTASYVLINDGSGAMSEEATLATSRGGLGVALTPSTPGQVIAVNSGGTAFTLQVVPNPPAMNVFNFYRYG